MNGETDKSSAGTMFVSSSPDQSITTVTPNDQQSTSVTANASILTPQSTYVTRSIAGTGLQDTEYANMNGAMSGSSSDGAEMYPESGTGGNGGGDGTTFTTPEGNSMPMDQLKQMLCSQLEYYFSRYVRKIEMKDKTTRCIISIISVTEKIWPMIHTWYPRWITTSMYLFGRLLISIK